MNKVKFAASMITVMSVSTLLMAACSSGTEKNGENTDEIVLNFPCIWVGADSKAEVFGEMVEEFNEENKGKYRVVIEEQTDYGAYKDKLRTLISTGNAPDLFTFSDYADIELYSKSGKLMDLTQFLKNETMGCFFVCLFLISKPVPKFCRYLHNIFLAPSLGLGLLPLFAIHYVYYFLCRQCVSL